MIVARLALLFLLLLQSAHELLAGPYSYHLAEASATSPCLRGLNVCGSASDNGESSADEVWLPAGSAESAPLSRRIRFVPETPPSLLSALVPPLLRPPRA
jgi:hypothetical protein